jgi:quinol monooxygenase YgiN
MIIIEGTVRIPEGGLEAARPAMEAMIQASRAEGGCHAYSYSVDLLDATRIWINERWESRDALQSHARSAHMGKWRSAAGEIGITDRSLRLYEADPQDL